MDRVNSPLTLLVPGAAPLLRAACGGRAARIDIAPRDHVPDTHGRRLPR